MTNIQIEKLRALTHVSGEDWEMLRTVCEMGAHGTEDLRARDHFLRMAKVAGRLETLVKGEEGDLLREVAA